MTAQEFFDIDSAATVRDTLETALSVLASSDRFAEWSETHRANTIDTLLRTAKFIDDLEAGTGNAPTGAGAGQIKNSIHAALLEAVETAQLDNRPTA